jgi:excisionase family DNA binding protein
MRVERFLTKTDVEVTLQLHRNTVTRLLSKGCFPRAFRTGGRWRIPVGDVQQFVANGGKPELAGQAKGVRGGH